jgi:signal transduction histidine kinase
LALTLVLAGIAILFGTRRPSLTQHSRGLVSMVAMEACVKLAGLLSVAGFCLWMVLGRRGGAAAALLAVPPVQSGLDLSFLTATLLCFVTAFTLPRQFHLSFVTLEEVDDARAAPWIVPVYFLAWPLAILAIAATVRAGLGVPGVSADMQMLALPVVHGAPAVALLALLGGLSAGAAMVVVETTAVSAMVANELVVPWLASHNWRGLAGRDAGRSILRVRRATILAVGLLGWAYHVGLKHSGGMAHLGFTALAAFAQLLPALVGAVYWRRGHARGAIAGIVGGMAVWLAAIVVPAFLDATGGIGDADGLPPWSESRAFQLAIYASLALNVALYLVVSLRTAPRLIDTIQATSFVGSDYGNGASGNRILGATVGDLRVLLVQFVGEKEARRALRSHADALDDAAQASPALARSAERLLAGVVGAPSARNLVAIALSAETQDAAEIGRILDEAAHAVQFGRELLQTTLDTLEQGVSVVDGEMRLVAWNASYLALMGLPIEQIHVGKPLADLLAGVADRVGGAEMRRYMSDRMAAIGRRERLQHEVVLEEGRTLRIIGRPLGLSDYLTTFVDITDLRQAERVLARSNEELEERVRQRTVELTHANAALAKANEVAERVTEAQRRFVAAASHDLVQPLHAARLFIGNALASGGPGDSGDPLLRRADDAVDSAHRLLRALLKLSQLEGGALAPRPEPVDAGLLLLSLFEEFAAQAELRGLELVVLPTRAWVLSDRDLLRSVLQNLILNAIRYTPAGRVVVACRPSGDKVRFEVRDSGVGISPAELPAAFAEYRRLPTGHLLTDGAGLGLSIVARISAVLGHPLGVRSRPGRGSVFSVEAPACESLPVVLPASGGSVDLGGLCVLCVDDEQDVLAGTTALIERWGGLVTPAVSAEQVAALPRDWDVAVADYRLGGADGLALLRGLASDVPTRLLVTATPSDELAPTLLAEGIRLFHKPVAPLALRAALAAAPRRQDEGAPSLANAVS